MRIDVHTHIFTLRAILTREAIKVMTQRLERLGCPPVLVKAVEELLDDLLDKPQHLDERHLLRLLIKKVTGDDLTTLLRHHIPSGPIAVRLDESLDDLATEALQSLLTDIIDDLAGPDGNVETVTNVIQALRAAMKPTITDVADDVLAYMDDDGVAVTLMMDVFAPPESPRDAETYRHHIRGTAEAALQRPGRILPFFGVHPDRPGHLDALKDAVENKGFVGVKLYPSLGYSVDSAPMRAVYEYCIEADLPVLLHCGHGGFYRDDQKRQLCDPDQWEDVLKTPPFKDTLRVCFAHFGGWKALAKRHCLDEGWDPDPDADGDPDLNWGKKIYDYMATYPNVYTDLAKHVTMFEDGADEQMYFDTMRELVADPKIGKRILYGSDAWLLRLDMPYDEYWAKWKAGADTALDDISIEGPRAFLGFPTSDRPRLAGNLERYVRYLRANREKVGREPATWLTEYIQEPFSPRRDPPDWDFSKKAVRNTYQFLGAYLTKHQRERGYRENRTFRLDQLPYYDKGDPNFDGRCRDMARRFMDFADEKWAYRPGHSYGSAVDTFVQIFRKGELRFCDVAMVVDSMIEYPESIS